MTLISFTSNYTLPVLIGDILVTRDFDETHIQVPSLLQRTDSLNKLGLEFSIHSLRRKIYIINDKLCIGMSGDLDQMYSYLNYMQLIFGNHVPSEDEFADHFYNYNPEKLDRISVVAGLGIKEDKSNKVAIFRVGNWSNTTHKHFDQVTVCGSGSQGYTKILNSFQDLYKFGESVYREKVISQNLMLLATFLGNEAFNASTLLERWGAGYEMIIYEHGKFSYFNNFSFIALRGSYEPSRGFQSSPILVMKFEYNGDILVIRSTDFITEHAFGAIPINKNHRDYNLEKIPIPDYQSDNMLIFYLIELPNKKIITPCMFQKI